MKKTKLQVLIPLLKKDLITEEEFETLIQKDIQYIYQPWYTNTYPAISNPPYTLTTSHTGDVVLGSNTTYTSEN
jgi:16S rRNA A1518/A1519 N6-dimethyltransferase RsmA/KsgA/DIM1 with predicted DNA glycosylase/AP lyase activity